MNNSQLHHSLLKTFDNADPATATKGVNLLFSFKPTIICTINVKFHFFFDY